MSFLDELTEVLRQGPGAADARADAWGFAPDAPSRAGLHFYAEASRRRRMGFVRWVFPALWRVLSETERTDLRARTLAGPLGQHPDWAFDTEGVVAAAAALAAEGSVPAAAAELADHEWTLFERRSVPVPASWPGAPAPLVPNPTLEVREARHDWAAWARDGGPLPQPEPEPVLLAYLMHPEGRAVVCLRLDESALAALKITHEQVGVAQAAELLHTTQASVHDLLEAHARCGLLTAAP